MTEISRRSVLMGLGAAGAAQAIPLRLAFADAPTAKRFAVVILRGGLDGLHAVAPYADPDYRRHRGDLAMPRPGADGGVVDLDGHWGLHPSLAPVKPLWDEGRLAVMQAVTTSYRARSHFDGQNVLENGTDIPYGADDGWLNRALGTLGGARLGLALGTTVPLILKGATGVQSWAPTRLKPTEPALLDRLAAVYARDPLFKVAFAQARASAKLSDEMGMNRNPGNGPQHLSDAAQAAGRLLSAPDGPRVAVMELGGWDTHFGQARRLAGVLKELAGGLTAFRAALGPVWDETAVAVVSEFGRTVSVNGTGGTDHGVGGIAFLLGGAVDGGRMLGGWPGLGDKDLYEHRDVRPVNDYRGMFKGLLHDHLGLAEGALEDKVFPESRDARAMDGLIRRA